MLAEMQQPNYPKYFLPPSFRNQEWSTRSTAIRHTCTRNHNPDDRLTIEGMDTPNCPIVRILVHSKLVKVQKVRAK